MSHTCDTEALAVPQDTVTPVVRSPDVSVPVHVPSGPVTTPVVSGGVAITDTPEPALLVPVPVLLLGRALVRRVPVVLLVLVVLRLRPAKHRVRSVHLPEVVADARSIPRPRKAR